MRRRHQHLPYRRNSHQVAPSLSISVRLLPPLPQLAQSKYLIRLISKPDFAATTTNNEQLPWNHESSPRRTASRFTSLYILHLQSSPTRHRLLWPAVFVQAATYLYLQRIYCTPGDCSCIRTHLPSSNTSPSSASQTFFLLTFPTFARWTS